MRSIQSCADMMFAYRSALALFFFTTQHWPGRQPRTFISFSIIFSFFFLFLVWIIFAFQILPVIWHLPFIFLSVLYQFYPSENIHNFTLLVFPRVEKEKNPMRKSLRHCDLGFVIFPRILTECRLKKSPYPMRKPKTVAAAAAALCDLCFVIVVFYKRKITKSRLYRHHGFYMRDERVSTLQRYMFIPARRHHKRRAAHAFQAAGILSELSAL